MAVFTPALAGCLLLLSWLQHRQQPALAVWGCGFLTASVAATLIIVARGVVSDFWSVAIGNALLAVAYGILWCGARTFEGKAVSIAPALLGALYGWSPARSVRSSLGPEARASVMVAIGMCYTLLAVLELWKGSELRTCGVCARGNHPTPRYRCF
jgi:hypothetical protein